MANLHGHTKGISVSQGGVQYRALKIPARAVTFGLDMSSSVYRTHVSGFKQCRLNPSHRV